MHRDHPSSPPGYQIEAVLGHGRRSVVYMAREQRCGREVALKVARRAHLQGLGHAPDFSADFALLSARAHPNIIRVFDHGVWGDKAFLTMEHAQAGSLERLTCAAPEVTAVARQAALALAALHGSGWVHRDVKPANLLVRADASLALGDVGSATTHGATDPLPKGTVVGTPAYAAPEQSEGAPADPAADVYSLGIVLWEMLTGKLPYPGKSPAELFCQHLAAPVPRLPAEHVSWQPLLDGMLAKHPGARPADGLAVLERLGHLRHSQLLPRGHDWPDGARKPS